MTKKKLTIEKIVDEVLASNPDIECQQYEETLDKIHFYQFFPKDDLEDYVVEIEYNIHDLYDNKVIHTDIINKLKQATIHAKEHVYGASIH